MTDHDPFADPFGPPADGPVDIPEPPTWGDGDHDRLLGIGKLFVAATQEKKFDHAMLFVAPTKRTEPNIKEEIAGLADYFGNARDLTFAISSNFGGWPLLDIDGLFDDISLPFSHEDGSWWIDL